MSGSVYGHAESLGAGYNTAVATNVTGEEPRCPYCEVSVGVELAPGDGPELLLFRWLDLGVGCTGILAVSVLWWAYDGVMGTVYCDVGMTGMLG